MKTIVLMILILFSQFLVSQEAEDFGSNISTNINQVSSRKGQFFASWGWNRNLYSKSDIFFKGNDFNFRLHNAKADDKRKVFADGFKESEGVSLPESNQINIKLGYFFSHNFNVVLGYDQMMYVMRNDQIGKISGTIATGRYLFEGEQYNLDGGYGYEDINYARSFVLFEHTNSLNYAFIGINRFDNLNKLFNINTDKFEINIEEGIDVGMVIPKTTSIVLGNNKFEGNNNTGFGFSANAGLNLTFFKHFFIKPEVKFGHINLKDLRITDDPSERAKQKFNFIETSLSLGVRFRLFSQREKPISKTEVIEKPVSKLAAVSSGSTNNTSSNTDALKKSEAENSTRTQTHVNIDSIKCLENKMLEYKEKFNNSKDQKEQQIYNLLSFYYNYMCQCANGSNRPEDLVAIINNIVDNYNESTMSHLEEILKVTSCRTLTKNKP